MFASRRFAVLRDFNRDVAVLNAYNQRRLGLREVPVAAITGTVDRTDLFDRARMGAWLQTPRYRRLLHALATGVSLPPVELYLLDGHYYIRDGHHRIAAACQLGILDVDAEVTECLPSPGAAAAWHRARGAFERDAGLIGLHIRRLDGYEWLRRQIAEHAWYLGEQSRAPSTFTESAAHWYREVYQPVISELARRGVLDRVPYLTATELYLAVCDHKWYRSERLGRDVGFAAAVAEFARTQRCPWLVRLVRCLVDARISLSRQLSGGSFVT